MNDFSISAFFVVRTPLFPLSRFLEWCKRNETLTETEQRAAWRDGLRQLIRDPSFAEALFLGSPSLEQALAHWQEAPESEQGQKAERSLVKYFSRACSRPTPFGLFAGICVGQYGDDSKVVLEPMSQWRKRTALDNDYLFALGEKLVADRNLRPHLRLFANSSLYCVPGGYRYLEAVSQGRSWRYKRVELGASPFLEVAIDCGQRGATLEELAARIVEADSDHQVTLAEAVDYVHELIDAQVLVTALQPLVTGEEPLDDLIAEVGRCSPLAPVTQVLEESRAEMAKLDSKVGASPDAYRGIAEKLEKLPAKVELARLFQVDLYTQAQEAKLGKNVVREVEKGIELVLRMYRPPATSTERFVEAFQRRFEQREVALTEVLDSEWGIGFGDAAGPQREGGALLQDLPFPALERQAPTRLPHEDVLRGKLARLAPDALELKLDDSDVKDLTTRTPGNLPDSFWSMVSVAADSAEAVKQGRFKLFIQGASGSSGMNALGRFCRGDERLLELVREHVRKEAELEPNAILAEIVHLPDGRIGNISSRPVLRDHEIVFLGRSGAARDKQIPITDLMVSVQQGRVTLRSRSLNRIVIPHLTNAHNYSMGTALYRFLCSIQTEGRLANIGWVWGSLDGLPFLPRVSHGRVVLSLARWRVWKEEVASWAHGEALPLAQWREQRRVPRWVELVDGDNTLLVDLENPLCVEALLSVVSRRPTFVLQEVFPGPDELWVEGAEGKHRNEILFSFLRHRNTSAEMAYAASAPVPKPQTAIKRKFVPGDDWLTLKIYAGPRAVDVLATDYLGPVVRELEASGAVTRWFFLRYADPDTHLRIRFGGEGARLLREVMPRIKVSLDAAMEKQLAWKVQLDTYEREIERYGGPEGMLASEEIFHADSEAVLGILQGLEGDTGTELRWQLAVRGCDALMTDFGLSLDEKHALTRKLRDGYRAEFKVDTAFLKAVGDRFSKQRDLLLRVMDATGNEAGALAPFIDCLATRSQRLAPIVARIRRLAREGVLATPFDDFLGSHLHMQNTRLLPAANRAYEVVMYDFLYRIYDARRARLRQTQGAEQVAGQA